MSIVIGEVASFGIFDSIGLKCRIGMPSDGQSVRCGLGSNFHSYNDDKDEGRQGH